MEWDALAGPEKFSFCRQNFLGIKTLQVKPLHFFAARYELARKAQCDSAWVGLTVARANEEAQRGEGGGGQAAPGMRRQRSACEGVSCQAVSLSAASFQPPTHNGPLAPLLNSIQLIFPRKRIRFIKIPHAPLGVRRLHVCAGEAKSW